MERRDKKYEKQRKEKEGSSQKSTNRHTLKNKTDNQVGKGKG